ncbi:MAPEG family protein [Fuscibacter oryzae]|uniref:MAPEG family protein n=1 Tax=Fuscibacter oryzae TaxID=2803939 RepID=A0A8J7MUD5_9RHOB|nr:MAPEG family protein [Fuscibacter oryzae]MBL4929797.1 MAPEG family protein [Fuscibacter oryzae]
MTPELTTLVFALLVQIGTLAAMSIVANRELGPKVTTGPRDGTLPAMSPLLGRLRRAVANGFEGLVLFAPAVLILAISGQSGPLTTATAWIYVAARILYVPAYAYGLVPWRSVIWMVSLLATLTLLVSTLI